MVAGLLGFKYAAAGKDSYEGVRALVQLEQSERRILTDLQVAPGTLRAIEDRRLDGVAGSRIVSTGELIAAVTGVSATQVSIIGGLLVAQLVQIDAQQQAERRQLSDLNEDLANLQFRRSAVQEEIYAEQLERFYSDDDVITFAVNHDGEELDVERMMEIGGEIDVPTERIVSEARKTVAEIRQAVGAIGKHLPGPAELVKLHWSDLRTSVPGLGRGIERPAAWRFAFEFLREDALQKERAARPADLTAIFGMQAVRPLDPDITFVDTSKRNIPVERDDLDRRIQELEVEVGQRRRAVNALSWPDHLWQAFALLGWLTVFGVVIPIWMLVFEPPRWLWVRWAPGATTAMAGIGYVGLVVYLGIRALLLGKGSRRSNHEPDE